MNNSKKISVGRKLDKRPLILSIVLSLLLGGIAYIMNEPLNSKIDLVITIGVMILTFILILFYYSLYLKWFYNYWVLTSENIAYIQDKNFKDSLNRLILGMLNKEQKKEKIILYKDIKSIELVYKKYVLNFSKKFMAFGPYVPQLIMPYLREPFFLKLKMISGEEINLDVSLDYSRNGKDYYKRLNDICDFIEKMTNKKVIDKYKIVEALKNGQNIEDYVYGTSK